MKQWYYSYEGMQKGPVSQEELEELRNKGTIKASDLVWHEGMESWKPYAEVMEEATPSEGGHASPTVSTDSRMSNSKIFSIVSLVMGVISISLCCCMGGLLTGPIGVVFGFLALKDNENAQERGIAIAGMVCSGLGILLSVAYLILNVMGVMAEIAAL